MPSKRKLTVILPDFLQLVKNGLVNKACPNLSLLLSRANKEKLRNAKSYFDHTLAALEWPANKVPPVAAIELLARGTTATNEWACLASPVNLAPNREHLSMVKSNGFQLSEAEAEAFCLELNDYFEEEGLGFSFTSPDVWFCHSESLIETANCAPDSILGQNIFSHLPSGENQLKWKKFFNELQMIMHHSATNMKRAQSGKPEINSIWLWGGGVLPESFSSPVSRIFSDSQFLKGFAKLIDAEIEKEFQLPESTGERYQGLVVFDDPMTAKDKNPWWELSDQMDKSLFEPVVNALKQKQLDELELIVDQTQSYVIKPAGLKKFWIRPKTIDKIANSEK